MALVDYDYKFIYVDIRCQRRISDGGVFRNSSSYEKMVNNSLSLTPPRPLPKLNIESWEPLENNDIIPFVIVADNPFPLTTGIMKPYPDKGLTDKKNIFGYRFSRYCRVTENAFGIIANVFRVFYSKINLSTDKATKLVLAAAVLHNMLRTGHANTYTPPEFADEIDGYNVVEVSWRKVQCQHISTTKIWKQFKTNGRKHKRILC